MDEGCLAFCLEFFPCGVGCTQNDISVACAIVVSEVPAKVQEVFIARRLVQRLFSSTTLSLFGGINVYIKEAHTYHKVSHMRLRRLREDFNTSCSFCEARYLCSAARTWGRYFSACAQFLSSTRLSPRSGNFSSSNRMVASNAACLSSATIWKRNSD